jgi:glutamate/tyrosine decarboxylase-like PLP-dependent enzyme
MEIWAVLKTLGRSGVADLVDRCCTHASAIAAGLREAGLEVINDVVLNQVLVQAGTDELTSRWIKGIQEDGTCWCGPTTWQGRTAMRVSVSGWSTTEDDVDLSLEAMVRCARQVGAL